MRIYKFEHENGAIDWVFAPSIYDAKKFYLNHTGCSDLDEYKISTVFENEWADNYILDINDTEPEWVEYNEDDYVNGYKIQETFAEYAARHTEIDIIATTEY